MGPPECSLGDLTQYSMIRCSGTSRQRLPRWNPAPMYHSDPHGPRSPQPRFSYLAEGFRRAETAQRMARGRDARPLSEGIPLPGCDRACVSDRRQARQRGCAAYPKGRGRFAGRADRRARAAARAARRLWNPQGFDIAFSVATTEWRMEIRRQANQVDSKAITRAIYSLLNYETVKYFNNEEYEARRYDENLQKYESAAVKNEASLGLLNIGQSCIIAVAVTLLMILAAEGVVAKTLTLGDLVLVNGLLIQLYIPLNFLGMVYREIKQALADMDRMFRLLTQDREIQDRPDAVPLPLGKGAGSATVRSERVDLFYEPRR